MPEFLNILFRSRNKTAPEDHPGAEDLACLAQGCLEEPQRGPVIRHVLECDRCYGIVEQTLAQLEQDESRALARKRRFQWPGLAVAASLLVGLVGVGVYYNLDQERIDGGPAPQVQEMELKTEAAPAPAPAPTTTAPQGPVSAAAPKAPPRTTRDLKVLEEKPAPTVAAEAQPPAGLVSAQKVSPKRKAAVAADKPKANAEGNTRALTKAPPPSPPPAQAPVRMTLHLRLDKEILALLRENPEQDWTNPDRINRFQNLIQEIWGEGISLQAVAWSGDYPKSRLEGEGSGALMVVIENEKAVLSLTGG